MKKFDVSMTNLSCCLNEIVETETEELVIKLLQNYRKQAIRFGEDYIKQFNILVQLYLLEKHESPLANVYKLLNYKPGFLAYFPLDKRHDLFQSWQLVEEGGLLIPQKLPLLITYNRFRKNFSIEVRYCRNRTEFWNKQDYCVAEGLPYYYNPPMFPTTGCLLVTRDIPEAGYLMASLSGIPTSRFRRM